ncbi:hypothetical protein C5167_000620 [Papaver somniferum]|uniref:Uncharacterized protein n=1 Tax=Papaver somniferum TaxID=3469 RepID=A0A4Y7KVP2_PAPSO|nr:hypothetical protein C5167_000620 [Papaver somniferum]
MGSITSTNGRQMCIGNHMWDVATERRDKKLVDKLYVEQNKFRVLKKGGMMGEHCVCSYA